MFYMHYNSSSEFESQLSYYRLQFVIFCATGYSFLFYDFQLKTISLPPYNFFTHILTRRNASINKPNHPPPNVFYLPRIPLACAPLYILRPHAGFDRCGVNQCKINVSPTYVTYTAGRSHPTIEPRERGHPPH